MLPPINLIKNILSYFKKKISINKSSVLSCLSIERLPSDWERSSACIALGTKLHWKGKHTLIKSDLKPLPCTNYSSANYFLQYKLHRHPGSKQS